MRARHGSAREGFTLLEVLVALFMFATVVGVLVSAVSTHIARLADAKGELRTMRRAEERLRAIETDARLGAAPEFGTTSGQFDGPDDDLSWELSVEPLVLPRPEELEGVRLAEDSIFSSEPPRRGAPGEDPRLRLIVVRVFPTEGDPEEAEEFSILLAPATALPEESSERAAEAGRNEAPQ